MQVGRDTARSLAIMMLAACAALTPGESAQAAPTPTEKCQQAKLKALGKYRLCLSNNAAGKIVGKPDEAAKCREKLDAARAKADAKALQSVTSCRFVDHGDSTITDLDTGLMWEKKTDDFGLRDYRNEFTWTETGTDPDGTLFSEFLPGLNNCESGDGIGTSTGLGGYCDWRVPTVTELGSILIPGCAGGPCIHPAFGPSANTLVHTVTKLYGSPNYHWMVQFFPPGYTVAVQTLTNSFNPARAVRGGQ